LYKNIEVCFNTSDVMPTNFINVYLFLFLFIFKIILLKDLSTPHILPTLYIFIVMNFVKCIGMKFQSICKDTFHWMLLVKKWSDDGLLTRLKLVMYDIYVLCKTVF